MHVVKSSIEECHFFCYLQFGSFLPFCVDFTRCLTRLQRFFKKLHGWWAMVGGHGGEAASSTGRSYHLPGGVRNLRRRAFKSVAILPPLPERIQPMGSNEEGILITPILSDISTHYGLIINLSPSLESWMGTPAGRMGMSLSFGYAPPKCAEQQSSFPLRASFWLIQALGWKRKG